MVDDILSRILCSPLPNNPERYNIMYSFLSKLDLRRKIGFLDETLRLLVPALPTGKRKRIIRELGKMLKFRNRIAHSSLDISEECLSKHGRDRIRLISYSGGKATTDEITKDEMKRRYGNLTILFNTLLNTRSGVMMNMTAHKMREFWKIVHI